MRQAANFINAHYAGEEMPSVRERLVADLDELRTSMNEAMVDLIAVAQSAMADTDDTDGEYVLAGETKLMNFAELSDIEKLKGLFDAFSKKSLILDLLDRSIDADGVRVFIGEESGYKILDDISVVTAPYRIDDSAVGVLGVIGPTRMAYDRVVPIVDLTARMLHKALSHR